MLMAMLSDPWSRGFVTQTTPPVTLQWNNVPVSTTCMYVLTYMQNYVHTRYLIDVIVAYEEDGQVLTPDSDSSSSPIKGDDRAPVGGVVWVTNPQDQGSGDITVNIGPSLTPILFHLIMLFIIGS